MPYNGAKALIDSGEPNAIDKYVPTLTVMEAKLKWIVSPLNTKGAEIPSSTLCVVNNILTTVRCKNCAKPRPVYVVGGGAKLKGTDKDLVHEFLENQSSTYTCGTDLLEQAASINFSDNTAEKRKTDKRSYRPYIPTYVGNLALCCMHPIEEKINKFDNHKKTCYVCGENSDDTPVINHYPLCNECHNKGWLTKPFTVIAKRKMNKKAKDNHTKPIEEEEMWSDRLYRAYGPYRT